MLDFASDYEEGCAPEILAALTKTNLVPQVGYGDDDYTQAAIKKIRLACAAPDAQVTLLVGGTQTNAVAIDMLLAPYAGMLCVDSAHIHTHEAGAVEATGHKVLAVATGSSKMTAAAIQDYLDSLAADPTREHQVNPGGVYITYPTELGELYTRAELDAIAAVCRANDLCLYLDGARLGYGLAAADDLTLADIAADCDAFYIGGTKIGALCGEALVVTNPRFMPAHPLTQIKRRGALLAKGRLLGVQFDTLFEDDLYLRLSQNALTQARRLHDGLAALGIEFFSDSPTNQVFITLSAQQLHQLDGQVRYTYWAKAEKGTQIRLVTSWATTADQVDALLALLK